MIARILLASALLTLTACSAELAVRELDPKTATFSAVNGVPFRVRDRFVVETYVKTAAGYELLHQQTETLPDPARLYLLEHTGQLLANSDSKFEVQEDSSLKSVHLGSSSQADEAMTMLTQQVTAMQKAADERDKAETTAAGAAADAELSYIGALGAVRLAEAKLRALPATATEAERVALEVELQNAKAKANRLARSANIAPPYPDVGG